MATASDTNREHHAPRSIVQACWHDSYSIGVPEVDEQHRGLLGIVRHLRTVQINTAGLSNIWPALADLNRYADLHFATEERLMVRYRLDAEWLAEHVAEHRGYRQRVHDFIERHRNGERGVVDEVVDFLEYWWMHHLLGPDRELGSLLRQAQRTGLTV
jgi:hemerythrin-like metal-binding protein